MRYQTEIKAGFVYVMTNPALREIVKVGASENVEARRVTLSAGLPYDYEVHHAEPVIDMWGAERRAHASLISRRIERSEFFRCTPAEAVAVIRGAVVDLEPAHVRHIQDIGAFVRKARGRNMLTAEQLARLVGVSRGAIQRLEAGEIGGTSVRTFLSVCDALSLTVSITSPASDFTGA